MKRLLGSACIIAVMMSGNPVYAAGPSIGPEAIFSDKGTLSSSIVKEIASARHSIRVGARTFRSKPVALALFNAAKSGVTVQVLLNRKTNSNGYSAGQFLLSMSYPPRLTQEQDNLYSDFILIDDRDLVEGNIAELADETEERQAKADALILHNAPELVKQYTGYWQTLWDRGEVMAREK